MIKALLHPKTEGERKMLILGLSEGNIEKLKEGCPILIKDFEPYDIVIHYGKMEESIKEELFKGFGK